MKMVEIDELLIDVSLTLKSIAIPSDDDRVF